MFLFFKKIFVVVFWSIVFWGCTPITTGTINDGNNNDGVQIDFQKPNFSNKDKIKKVCQSIVSVALIIDLVLVIRKLTSGHNAMWAVIAWLIAVVFSVILFSLF